MTYVLNVFKFGNDASIEWLTKLDWSDNFVGFQQDTNFLEFSNFTCTENVNTDNNVSSDDLT